MFVPSKDRKPSFNGKCCNPDIVNRDHHPALLEVEVNPRIHCRSECRNMKHDSVANNLSDVIPGSFRLAGFKNAKIELRERDKRYREILSRDLLLDLRIPAEQSDNCVVSAMKSIGGPFMEFVQRHRRCASRT